VNATALNATNVAGLIGYIGALFVAIASVFIQYRRSRGLERLQMRWFMVGVVGTGVAFVLQLALLAAGCSTSTASSAAPLLTPP
jgi:hypothetical protein